MNHLRVLPGLILACALAACVSCSDTFGTSESKLRTCADSFAVYYFNYRFADARRFCTPESERWLRYAASNVYQADVDLLCAQEEPAEVEVTDVALNERDSVATVQIEVRNFLQSDTIGTSGHWVGRASFCFGAVYADKRWLIRMEGLPRSERRSRD